MEATHPRSYSYTVGLHKALMCAGKRTPAFTLLGCGDAGDSLLTAGQPLLSESTQLLSVQYDHVFIGRQLYVRSEVGPRWEAGAQVRGATGTKEGSIEGLDVTIRAVGNCARCHFLPN